jgi:hypothetical protein
MRDAAKMSTKTSTTILFGNGFNRLTNSSTGWSDVLESIRAIPNDVRHDLPYTMIYELIREDRHDKGTPDAIKSSLASKLRQLNNNDLYRRLWRLPIDNYLTTNYDYCFENSCGAMATSRSTENIYSIRRVRDLSAENRHAKLWHIHGDVDFPRSMMLGLNHYCGAAAKMSAYIKGGYRSESISLPKIRDMKSRVKDGDFNDISWIDLFFSSDVHILGLSLEYSEIDLWWLLNRRHLLSRDNLITNEVTYHATSINTSKMAILNHFGVSVKQYHVPNRDYGAAYEQALDCIEKELLHGQ